MKSMFSLGPNPSYATILHNHLLGIAGSFMSFSATLLHDIDTCIRIAAGIFGIILTILTIIRVARDLFKK